MNWYNNKSGSILFALGEALEGMKSFESDSFDLILSDPPWNTGSVQSCGDNSYPDTFVNFKAFLVPHLQEMRRLLTNKGTLVLHMGYQEAHSVKLWLDEVFGASSFYGEIITYSELGRGSGKSAWAIRHSYIFIYHKVPGQGFVDAGSIPTVARKAPKKTAASGTAYAGDDKPAFSVIPYTMSNSDPQRVGYPSQKHVKLYEALVRVHCPPGGMVLDPFAGSGTTGAACLLADRGCVLFDRNAQSLQTCTERFELVPE